MRKFNFFFLFFLCVLRVQAQNWTAVSANNIADLAGNKLASGKLCFTATDQNNQAISFQIGGGGQTLAKSVCTPIANGAIGPFQVPNPAYTIPADILYRIEVSDGYQVILRYLKVALPPGMTFNFDSYTPNIGAVLSGASVDRLTVGN